jgi:hypothetical protein
MPFARSIVGLLLLGLIAASAALGSPGTPAVLEHVPPARLFGHSDSLNWAGYASTNSTFDDVKGSWTQPDDRGAVDGRRAEDVPKNPVLHNQPKMNSYAAASWFRASS